MESLTNDIVRHLTIIGLYIWGLQGLYGFLFSGEESMDFFGNIFINMCDSNRTKTFIFYNWCLFVSYEFLSNLILLVEDRLAHSSTGTANITTH